MTVQDYIQNIVNECVQENKENALREGIRPIIAEGVMEMGKQNKGKIKVGALVKKLMKNPEFKKKALEYLSDEDAYNGWSDALNGKTYDSFDNLSDGAKRRSVTQRLKDDKIDCAPIAYELWPNMSQDAARSWFYKKVDGKNEQFTDEEVAQIYTMLNNQMGSGN